jgi:hypothetical protein
MPPVASYSKRAAIERRFLKLTTPTESPWAYQSNDSEQRWAAIFTLDASIGNRDRHHDHWGIIEFSLSSKEMPPWPPAFGNGDALGRDIFEKEIDDYQGKKLEK